MATETRKIWAYATTTGGRVVGDFVLGTRDAKGDAGGWIEIPADAREVWTERVEYQPSGATTRRELSFAWTDADGSDRHLTPHLAGTAIADALLRGTGADWAIDLPHKWTGWQAYRRDPLPV